MTFAEVAEEIETRIIRFLRPMKTAIGRYITATRATRLTNTGRIWFCSMNISTATTEQAWEHRIKRAGPRLSPSYSNEMGVVESIVLNGYYVRHTFGGVGAIQQIRP